MLSHCIGTHSIAFGTLTHLRLENSNCLEVLSSLMLLLASQQQGKPDFCAHSPASCAASHNTYCGCCYYGCISCFHVCAWLVVLQQSPMSCAWMSLSVWHALPLAVMHMSSPSSLHTPVRHTRLRPLTMSGHLRRKILFAVLPNARAGLAFAGFCATVTWCSTDVLPKLSMCLLACSEAVAQSSMPLAAMMLIVF